MAKAPDTETPQSDPSPPPVAAGAEDAGERLDRFLARRLSGLSRSRLKQLIETGRVSESGATLSDPSQKVKAGQVFRLDLPPVAPATPLGQAMDLAIVYEDEDLIVIDKPAGIVVHPAPGNPDKTLVNALIAHCGESLSGIGGERRPGIVHRLDKDTSGPLVAAKNDAAHQALAADFAARRIDRHYLAVSGACRPREGDRGGHRPPSRRPQAHGGGQPGRAAASPATGWWRPWGWGRAWWNAGWPRAGPTRSGSIWPPSAIPAGRPGLWQGRRPNAGRLGPAGREALAGFCRQALHAASLGFRHPRTGAWLAFESPIPPDLSCLINALK
jgi:23S rRNA pseudouridine1911/1915/1917 synthase